MAVAGRHFSDFMTFTDGIGFEEHDIHIFRLACEASDGPLRQSLQEGFDDGALADAFARSMLRSLEGFLPIGLRRCVTALKVADGGH